MSFSIAQNYSDKSLKNRGFPTEYQQESLGFTKEFYYLYVAKQTKK